MAKLAKAIRKMTFVFDSSSLIAFLWNEDGADVVENLLIDSKNSCMAHAINLCEIYYDLVRRAGELAAQNTSRMLASILKVREDLDPALWQQAGRYKAELRHVSLADCFCLALAKRVSGTVVSTDHHEFDTVAEQGIVPIKFIR